MGQWGRPTLLIDILLGNRMLLLAYGAQDAREEAVAARRAGVLVGLVLGVVEVKVAEEAGEAADGPCGFVRCKLGRRGIRKTDCWSLREEPAADTADLNT